MHLFFSHGHWTNSLTTHTFVKNKISRCLRKNSWLFFNKRVGYIMATGNISNDISKNSIKNGDSYRQLLCVDGWWKQELWKFCSVAHILSMDHAWQHLKYQTRRGEVATSWSFCSYNNTYCPLVCHRRNSYCLTYGGVGSGVVHASLWS